MPAGVVKYISRRGGKKIFRSVYLHDCRGIWSRMVCHHKRCPRLHPSFAYEDRLDANVFTPIYLSTINAGKVRWRRQRSWDLRQGSIWVKKSLDHLSSRARRIQKRTNRFGQLVQCLFEVAYATLNRRLSRWVEKKARKGRGGSHDRKRRQARSHPRSLSFASHFELKSSLHNGKRRNERPTTAGGGGC